MIQRIYLSNFLTGLVFWYSIEKVFMRGIGLGADSIGVIVAVTLAVTLALDVPAGMLADRWSRKGLLAVSAAALAGASLLAGLAHGLGLYLAAASFYAVYLVCTSGTYQALVYDVLHEEGRAGHYSRIMGTAYALFLVGAAVANVGGGLIAQVSGSLRLPFFLTIIPCLVNAGLLLSIREPTFHKELQRGRVLHDLGRSLRTIGRVLVVRSLVITWLTLAVAEVFKQDFGQLYALAFTSSAMLVAVFWAVYALLWALGSYLGHRLVKRLDGLLVLSCAATVGLGFIRSPWGIALFLVQVVASAAAYNLLETRVQQATPSEVRASILSVVSTLSRLVQLPFVLVLGWLISRGSVFAGLQLVAGVAALGLVYWVLVGRQRLRDDVRAVAS
jgi:MFS family permease